jgi:hypothetical protein
MIYILVIIALGLYAVRYAFSGADNALVYNDAVAVPDIHNSEQAQQLASTTAHVCYLIAIWILMEWSLWDALGLAFSLSGAVLVGDYHFNKFIMRATGKPKPASWYWPFTGWEMREVFHGATFWLEPIVGVGLFFLGLALWTQ